MMNSYEIGFMNKCAEYGVDPYDLSEYINSRLVKSAQVPAVVAKKSSGGKRLSRILDAIRRRFSSVKTQGKTLLSDLDLIRKLHPTATALGATAIGGATAGAGIGGYNLGKEKASKDMELKSLTDKLKYVLKNN